MPFYTALTRDEFVHSDASLDALLAFVLEVIDPTLPEDVTIWANNTVAAVVLACGRVVRFDAPPRPWPMPWSGRPPDRGRTERGEPPVAPAAGGFFVDRRGRRAYYRRREFRKGFPRRKWPGFRRGHRVISLTGAAGGRRISGQSQQNLLAHPRLGVELCSRIIYYWVWVD
jgi:hypothetical protein